MPVDDEPLDIVYETQGERHVQSRTRGRHQPPAEVVLRMLILKHLRNWSYETLEREAGQRGVPHLLPDRSGESGIASTSCNTGPVSFKFRRVSKSSSWYSRLRLFSPSGPLWRKACAIAMTRFVTLRIRLRTFRFSPPTFSIRFMPHVITRGPSCSRPLSVGLMNIGFHHCRIHAHLAILHYLALLRHRHNSVVQLADGFRSNSLAEPHQRLCIPHGADGKRRAASRSNSKPSRSGCVA